MSTAEYRISLINSDKNRPAPFENKMQPCDMLAVDADMDQDWETGTTTYSYPDGSAVLASAGSYEAIN